MPTILVGPATVGISSINTPLDIPMLQAWYDPSDPTTITDAGSGHCSQLNDKGPALLHLTQATDGNRPITGTRTINGLNTLDFNGSSQQLTRVNTQGIPYGCIYAIFEPDNVTGQHPIVGPGGTLISLYLNGATPTLFCGTGSGAPGGANAVIGTPMLARGMCWASGVAQTRSGGTEGAGTGSVGSLFVITTQRLGSDNSSFFDGKIGEVIILTMPPPPAMDNAIRLYLAPKWNVTP